MWESALNVGCPNTVPMSAGDLIGVNLVELDAR